ncbi:hypothetical protein SAMN05443572_10732 [Myxococcus fulvus]|uniref:Lipoprotein n=1 Tax=Myxococcus fulvus TaxID=33 RepID=A0A511T8Z7_MYXFU|nr:hypothetical protein [Myxococcus fulvus]GEN10063.1 hypothetical protein MFU01_51000 [Myxococcus fulvus]SEU25015.1 hypothetical protein SAMN05443572_10732 [Myxococcus fulvus]
MTRGTNLLWTLPLTLLAVACGEGMEMAQTPENTPAVEELGEAKQGLVVTGRWGWGTPGNSGPDLDLGPSNTQTCFLTGVRGNLKGQSAHPYNPISSVGVYEEGGRWKLKTRDGIGTGVVGEATCIANTANRVSMSWSECTSFSCAFPYVPVNTNRRCFITSIWSRAGMTFHYQGDSKPGLLVSKQTIYPPNGGASYDAWVLKGWSSDDASEPANMGGTAHCVDFPGGGVADGSWEGNATVPMCNGASTVGLLRGVFGDFTGGYEDGVTLTKNDATGWTDLKVTNGKTGYVSCVW